MDRRGVSGMKSLQLVIALPLCALLVGIGITVGVIAAVFSEVFLSLRHEE